jgi:aclacinomycin oxidase
MSELKRRGFLAGAVMGGVAVGTGAYPVTAVAQPRHGACVPPNEPATITPDDLRYDSELNCHNLRFVGQPEYVRVVNTTGQVADAVREAVASGKRVVVRSGGHCFENFTSANDIQVLIDMSQMSAVYFDGQRNAFAIEAGAPLGRVYRTLFKEWGVTIPAGSCFEVAAGGHFAGGGYGHLSRSHGMVIDHLYAVEVVVVDGSGRVRTVVATREPDDPHRDLWWASAGGGGGNFGVVTRYWLRTPGVNSTDPSRLLPRAPGNMRRRTVMWPWDSMTQSTFSTLTRNYCDWFEHNSAPGSANFNLWSILLLNHRSAQSLGMVAVIDEDVTDAEQLLNAKVDTITAGVDVEPVIDSQQVIPWMTPQNWPDEPAGRYKHKAADLRKGYTDEQIATIWRHLSDTEYTNPAANLGINGYGGQVNAIAPDATAASRGAILRAVYTTGNWESPDDDAKHLAWVRSFYHDVHADTGGVPVPNEVNAGCYVNYVDVDLADPAMNKSGVPWHTLYYKDNYPRLQQIKRRYDPRNVFHHPLSVRLPD